MLELKSVQEIIKALAWISTLGLSEVKGVKSDIIELISELSKSLTNLWEVVTQVTKIKEDNFTKESFVDVYDYFVRFYVGDWNISPARTHCGNVERTVERIKFKLPKILHTELGKWDEVDEQLKQIVDRDGEILREYDASINKLDSDLREIKDLLEPDAFAVGKQKYYGLKKNLEADIRMLKSGVERMEQASNHIHKIVG